MSEQKKLIPRHDITGTVLVDAATGVAQGHSYRRCPHCGLVDYQHSAQGLKQSHFPMSRVGADEKYECGKCRKQFYAIQVCVPADMTPLDMHEKINNLLAYDQLSKGEQVP